jgi:hypothetical protein
MAQHLELRDILIDVSCNHLEFLELVMGFLLLGVVHEGSPKVFFEYCLRRSSQKFVFIILHPVQPVVVPLDPSSSFLSSNVSHEVGAFLVRVPGYGRVSVHNHEPLEGD